MLVALENGRRMEASVAEKGQAYSCPKCAALVILKKGRVTTHHFAHKPPTNCTWASKETSAHMKAKTALCEALRQQGFKAELEVEILSSGGDRRADVVAWSKDGKSRVAFEIQHQPLSFDGIEQRIRGYIAAGVPVLWIGLLMQNAHPTKQRECSSDGRRSEHVLRRTNGNGTLAILTWPKYEFKDERSQRGPTVLVALENGPRVEASVAQKGPAKDCARN